MKIDQVFIIALFTKRGNKNITIILNELAANSRLNKTLCSLLESKLETLEYKCHQFPI